MRSSRRQLVNTIYIIKSIETPKVYIGQTWHTLTNRLSSHKRNARNGTGRITKLYNSMRKYGIDSFTIEKLDQADSQESANFLEDYYITQYDSIINGLNLKCGGAVGKFSEESRKKMSLSHLGEKNNNHGKRGPGITFYGGHHTDESKKKISDAMRNVIKRELSLEEKEILKTRARELSKLDEHKVREIKILLRDGKKIKDIAILYDVTDSCISHIRAGRSWSSVFI